MSSFPVLLGAIVIETGETDGVVLDEAGVDIPGTIAAGTYYIKGDGASDDFLLALKTALDAAGANTYAVSLESGGNPTWSRSTASRAVTITVSRTAGAATFRVRWNVAGTTFGASRLGFVTEKGAADANAESSTVSPTSVWVGDNYHEDVRELPSWEASEQVLESGDVDVVWHSETVTDCELSLPMCADANLFIRDETITNRSLQKFLASNGDGRPVQVHELPLQAGSSTLLDDLSASTLFGTFRLGSDAARCLADSSRSQLGMRYSDLALVLRSYVAP